MEFFTELLKLINKIDALVFVSGLVFVAAVLFSPISYKGTKIDIHGTKAIASVILGIFLIVFSFQETRLWLFRTAQIASLDGVNKTLGAAKYAADSAAANKSDAKQCSALAGNSSSHIANAQNQINALIAQIKPK